MAASAMPSGSTVPCHGCVNSSTPVSANAGHTSRARLRLRRTATPSGPRNSIATAVPSGMRSIAARKLVVISPVVTPSARAARRSAHRSPRTCGRLMSRKMTAPAVSRSQAVPPAPTVSKRLTDRAAPICTLSIAATASDHAGTRCVIAAGACRPRRLANQRPERRSDARPPRSTHRRTWGTAHRG